MAKVLFYGDDFTGASDNSAQYYRSGLSSLLFFSDPGEAALHEAAARHDVIGVAGTARTLPAAGMAEELLPIFEKFHQLGAPLIQYKCCSTFDSSPHIGSLGEAIRLMRSCWPGSFVPVLAATPEFGRYTVFGNHFARLGNDVHRLDRHPTMSRHPVTPIDEADLSRLLAAQGFTPERLVDIRALDRYAGQADSLAEALTAADSAVFDGLNASHVTTVAGALWRLAQTRPVTALAAQGLGYGLGLYLRETGMLDAPMPTHRLAPVDRLLVLSGSCSPQSAAQIAWARDAGFLELRLSPEVLLDPTGAGLARIESDMLAALRRGRSLVAYTASGPEDPAILRMRELAGDRMTGPAWLADRIGALFARLGRAAIEQGGLRRLVVAGGDSSSFAMGHLGAQALEMHASHFEHNAHVGRLRSTDRAIDGVEVLLKGGQVGAADLYGVMRDGF